jgi:hypothetical protein
MIFILGFVWDLEKMNLRCVRIEEIMVNLMGIDYFFVNFMVKLKI